MTINHRTEAEKHLATASRYLFKTPADTQTAAIGAAIGQGHATLARDEEQAATTADLRDAITLLRIRSYAMRNLISTHVAEALASREPGRWKAGKDLTRALDEADCNVDDLVDTWLSDHEWDPRAAYKAPDAGGGWGSATAGAAPERDPWAPKPDITADIPEPVRRVLVEYLAAALLSKGDAQGVGQTITFALKHAGADLTGDIEKQITSIALGSDPSDPPF